MWQFRGQKRPDFAILPGPGQESVWDYPRPPKLASDSRLVEVYCGDQVVVQSVRTCRVLETASPPTFYIPPQDVNWDLLVSAPGNSVCELNKKLTNSFIVLILSIKTTTNYRLPFKWGRSSLSQEVKMDKNSRNSELFVKAMSHLMEDKLGMSIDLLDEILKADPDNRLALLARGSVYLKLGNSSNAVSDFSKAIEIDPKHPKAYHLRGLAREMAGENVEALTDFNKAIDIEPKYGAAYYSRATLLTKMGQEDAATEDIEMVTHLTNLNLENFANDNNIWRSRQMQLEGILESELDR